jgi:pSer/pThr/pTyr-binding forkhead associated (FHA) protein
MTGLALKIVAGTGRGAFFALQAGTYTIGRDADNPIQIDSPMVSRRHAELRIQPDQVIICDLKSANGTVVNHRKIDESELRPGDKIFIGDSILEFSAAASQIEQRQHRETVIGNIADLSSTPSGSAPIALKMLSGVDWKFKLLIILLAALLLDHLIISQLFSQRLLQDARQTSLKRAGDITRYLAEKNKLDLAQGNETLLDVDVVMKDEGVLGAFITNESGRILVPSYKLNQQLTDETSKQALASQTNEVFRSPRLESDVYRFATPIRIYREKQADYQTLGIAMVVFSPKNLVSSREASRKIWLLALGLIPITVLILFFMIQFVTIPPINYLVEMIGKLFRGEIERIDRQTSIESLRPLIDAVNSAAIRMQQNLSSGLTSSIQPIENKDFLSENSA